MAERRTIVIRGQVTPPPRRPAPRTRDLVGPNPDRVAMWAFLLAVALVLAALVS